MSDLIEDHPIIILIASAWMSLLIAAVDGKYVIPLAVMGVVTILYTVIITCIIKAVVGIRRDYDHKVKVFRYRFPSLHAAGAYAGASIVSLYLGFQGFTFLLWIFAFFSSYTRMRYHTWIEILAGMILGSSCAWTVGAIASLFI